MTVKHVLLFSALGAMLCLAPHIAPISWMGGKPMGALADGGGGGGNDSMFEQGFAAKKPPKLKQGRGLTNDFFRKPTKKKIVKKKSKRSSSSSSSSRDKKRRFVNCGKALANDIKRTVAASSRPVSSARQAQNKFSNCASSGGGGGGGGNACGRRLSRALNACVRVNTQAASAGRPFVSVNSRGFKRCALKAARRGC